MKTAIAIISAAILLFSFLSATGAATVSQDGAYRFTHINSSSGLSYNSIKCLLQDSRGFIWIGTYKGLDRYDGTRIKNYGKEALGVQSEYINALIEDCSGNILVATDDGLVIYDYHKDCFRRPVNPDLLNDRIYAMCEDSDGHIWIGSRSQGVFVYSPQSCTLAEYPLCDETGTALTNAYRMSIDGNDRIYLASYCENLFYFEKGAETACRVTAAGDGDFFVKDDIEGLCVNPKKNNLLYIASKRRGLCELNVSTGHIRQLYEIPGDSRPVSLDICGTYLWLSTTSGLLRYDVMDLSCIWLRYDNNDRFSLSDDFVTSVLTDDKGGLWIGTAYGGVNYHGRHQDLFQKFYMTSDGESLEGSVVCDFAQDDSGTVWIATERSGLLRYDIASGSLERFRLPMKLDHINALYCSGDWLWIGFHNGICRYNLADGRMVAYPHFIVSDIDIDNRVLDIFMSFDGTIYVCTSIGVMKYDSSADSFVKIDCLGEGAMEHIVEDSRGTIWLASYSSGVYAYDSAGDSVTGHWCHKNGEGNIPEMMSSMCIGEDGQVWAIGFGTGFFKYDYKARDFRPFNSSVLSALPTDMFFSALPDDDGDLWLSSDKGLVRFSAGTESVSVYDAMSGILDADFRKSCIRLLDGSMMFGSSDGFIHFNPDDFRGSGSVSAVSVTDLIVDGRPVVPSGNVPLLSNIDLAEKVILKAESNSFGLTFAVPGSDFLTGGRVLCLLEGYDAAWRDISSSMDIYYYNIPEGSYTLKIAVTGPDSRPVTAHKDIQVEILPKFWESTAGISIVIVVVLAICAAAYVVIYRRLEQKHNRIREEMENAREKEMLQEKITFFSNIVHEIKTPLTLIRTPLQNIMAMNRSPDIMEELSIINNSTDYLDKLVKELLDFIRVEKHGYVLEYKNIDVIDRINYIKFNFSEIAKNSNLKLTFEYSVSPLIAGVDPGAFDKIINNLLHNAVKYAGSRILIKAYTKDDNVVIAISNDGRQIPEDRRSLIFKPFVQFSDGNTRCAQSFGIGLSLARMLAELHGGTLDLSDNKETEFVLVLPLRTVPESSSDMNGEEEDGMGNGNLPLLLLVEDNHDLNVYLKKKLRSEYNVLAVPSGEKALTLLRKYKVDIILTDIVLEGMDGIELCRKVSEDFEISHIPVIVLSAISSVEVKIRAVENGAVLYIEKPFTLEYLLACIKGTLDKRRQLKALAREDPVCPDMASFGLVNRDEDFLRRLDRIVSGNIGNPEFAVQQLEEAMYMSRSSLTRKIKGLLNITPVDYIRTKRLSAAAAMLRTGHTHVNEVCYAVGFSSPSYFSKCFKALYGVLPAEYARSVSGDDGNTSSKDETN